MMSNIRLGCTQQELRQKSMVNPNFIKDMVLEKIKNIDDIDQKIAIAVNEAIVSVLPSVISSVIAMNNEKISNTVNKEVNSFARQMRR